MRKSLLARCAVALAFLAGATPSNVSLCRFVHSGPRPPDVSQVYGCDLSFTAVIEAARVVERRINTCGHPDLEPLEEARR